MYAITSLGAFCANYTFTSLTATLDTQPVGCSPRIFTPPNFHPRLHTLAQPFTAPRDNALVLHVRRAEILHGLRRQVLYLHQGLVLLHFLLQPLHLLLEREDLDVLGGGLEGVARHRGRGHHLGGGGRPGGGRQAARCLGYGGGRLRVRPVVHEVGLKGKVGARWVIERRYRRGNKLKICAVVYLR